MMTVTSAADLRAVAQLRRNAADAARHASGDIAYRRFRSAAPGIGAARQVPTKTVLRAELERRNGREMYHTFGYFTRYGRYYPMWDMFGEYEECTRQGSGRKTLASNPDVAWLVNHKGVTMARTKNGTLELEERAEGGWHDGWLNPERQDVKDIIVAIQDRSVDEMSYAFMIPENGGWWNDDFTRFDIVEYDINRGDVSAVNYGANPYTDIAARSAEVLRDLEHLPAGALAEASARLARRSGQPAARERVEVRGQVQVREQRGPRPAPGAYRQRLAARIERVAARFAGHPAIDGDVVRAMQNTRLPWYMIANADGDTGGDTGGPDGGNDTATVFIFDEIGGSFGVDAKTFAADLQEITAPNITVRINSPGGSVFDGIAIHSALLHHPARVTTYVDGLAASAASFIAMAGDEVVMMPGSQMMIHDASATVDGNADDMGRMVSFLDRQSDNIADLYVRKAGGSRDEWRELMLAETWAFAEEAVELGLADRVSDTHAYAGGSDLAQERAMRDRMRRNFNLSHFRYAGRRAAPAPQRRTAAGDPGQPRTRMVDGPIAASGYASSVLTAEAQASVALDGETIDVGPVTVGHQQGSATQDQPRGRSIKLIEALYLDNNE